jgi:fatty-acyl-CoA synthase
LNQLEAITPTNTDHSAAKAWLRALQLTASIPENRERVLSTVIDELAERCGASAALLSDRECFTYQELVERSRQYARWALDQGLQKGDVVGLLMTNRPEYFAVWLGITSIGGVVALLNTNLVGPSLTHCLQVVSPKHLIVTGEFIDACTSSVKDLTVSPIVWTHGFDRPEWSRIDAALERLPGAALTRDQRPSVTIEDRALYIFTSGTTGLPKAASVSHARVMQWAHWFAGMMGAEPSDRIYSCLPMYHSIGGVLVPGAAMVAGSSVVIREKFSARQFWSDVTRWDCTILQYIGEFCRYLLHAGLSAKSRHHRIRLACGNGMAADVWEQFRSRFQIPQILEFYAATEGGLSLFNAEGEPGAIGRIPAYLRHRFSPALIRIDVEAGEPVRNEDGFCIRCGPNQPGEAITRMMEDPSGIGSRFEGYTDPQASERKILRNVLATGDAWIRTGDLMRRDERGFFYFVDRIGDTFRWKGENVATTEVADAICAFPGVQHASVYGVRIPLTEGRAGMAAVVTDYAIDLAAFRKHLTKRLPSYARPVFLRFCRTAELTGTFKYSKTELIRQAFDPTATTDAVYFDSAESGFFHRLDAALYQCIRSGQIRL